MAKCILCPLATQLSGDEVLAAAMGTLPGRFQQTYVEGEQHALLWRAAEAERGVNIQIDCASVLAHQRKTYQISAWPRTQFAGYRQDRTIAL